MSSVEHAIIYWVVFGYSKKLVKASRSWSVAHLLVALCSLFWLPLRDSVTLSPPSMPLNSFCCGFDSIFGHFLGLCRRHVSCAHSTEPFLGHLKGRSALAGILSSNQSILSREINTFQSLSFKTLSYDG